MAYTTPPTFSNGSVLTATQLNTLSGDVEYLYSVTHGMNIGFTGEEKTTDGYCRPYTYRRRARYLHYKIRVTAASVHELRINVNGNDELTDTTERSSGYTYSGYFDLTAITAPPSALDFYSIQAWVSLASGGVIYIDYYIESNATTL